LITGIILPLRDHACVRPWGIDDGKSPADIRGKKVNVRIINRFQISFGTGQEVTDLIVDMPKQVELFEERATHDEALMRTRLHSISKM
jgi:hypothetical protein